MVQRFKRSTRHWQPAKPRDALDFSEAPLEFGSGLGKGGRRRDLCKACDIDDGEEEVSQLLAQPRRKGVGGRGIGPGKPGDFIRFLADLLQRFQGVGPVEPLGRRVLLDGGGVGQNTSMI